MAPAPPSAPPGPAQEVEQPLERPSTASSESMPPPPQRAASATPGDDAAETRSVRSSSSASRNPNRLSLTLPLPIALPTSNPSRPSPATASTLSSMPPTPVDSPGIRSPSSSDDFITAIAAQERKVLELREELIRADKELSRLKKQWSIHEAHKKKQEKRGVRPLQLIDTSSTSEEEDSKKRTVELDRRKALLLGQQSAPGTPTQSRRRVFHGGHTRQLSLLSPTKSDSGGDFSVHEDPVLDQLKTSSKELDEAFAGLISYAPATPANLSKRASWAPRTVHSHAASGVKQIAEDFRAQLWTFVEDLRQATVGEEPITGHGQPLRSFEGSSSSSSGTGGMGGPTRSNLNITSFVDDQDTIRAPSTSSARPHVARAFEDTPTPPSRFTDPLRVQEDAGNGSKQQGQQSGAKPAAAKTDKSNKRFSWQPLTVDSFDDSDWSNWDSPTVKSPRWSGSTAVSENGVSPVPEKTDQNEALKNTHSDNSGTPSSLSSAKLEELGWPVLNRLTPSKLKQHASDFMKEWERSLSPPGAISSFDGAAFAADDKVKGT